MHEQQLRLSLIPWRRLPAHHYHTADTVAHKLQQTNRFTQEYPLRVIRSEMPVIDQQTGEERSGMARGKIQLGGGKCKGGGGVREDSLGTWRYGQCHGVLV